MIYPLSIFLGWLHKNSWLKQLFPKIRLKDVNLLDMLMNKTVEIAIEKELIKSKVIIVDATHTKTHYNQKLPKERLMDYSNKIRKSVYEIDESMKGKFPSKSTTNELKEELENSQKLIDAIEREETIFNYPKVK